MEWIYCEKNTFEEAWLDVLSDNTDINTNSTKFGNLSRDNPYFFWTYFSYITRFQSLEN